MIKKLLLVFVFILFMVQSVSAVLLFDFELDSDLDDWTVVSGDVCIYDVNPIYGTQSLKFNNSGIAETTFDNSEWINFTIRWSLDDVGHTDDDEIAIVIKDGDTAITVVDFQNVDSNINIGLWDASIGYSDIEWAETGIGPGGGDNKGCRYINLTYNRALKNVDMYLNGTLNITDHSANNLGTYGFDTISIENVDSSGSFLWVDDMHIGETSVGNYNITFRWECNNTIITDTNGSLLSTPFVAENSDGTQVFSDTVDGNTYTPSIGSTPDIFRYDFGNDGMWRSIKVVEGQSDYTAYVCCYPEWDGLDANYSAYQFLYTFNFQDYTPTSDFVIDNTTYATIFTKNSTGTYNIHQDYFDAQDKITVYLHYGERYWIGVANDERRIPMIQYFDTLVDTSLDIVIPPYEDDVGAITDYVTVNTSYGQTILWTNYTDSSSGTQYVNLIIYAVNLTDDTLTIVNQTNFSVNEKSYSIRTGNGFVYNTTYKVVLTITHGLFSTNQTIVVFCYPFYYDPDITGSWIDQLIDDNVFDISGTLGIGFVQIFIFFVAFGAFLSGGNYYASVGFLSAGGVLCVCYSLLFVVTTAINSAGILIGVAMIIFGLVLARSDFK